MLSFELVRTSQKWIEWKRLELDGFEIDGNLHCIKMNIDFDLVDGFLFVEIIWLVFLKKVPYCLHTRLIAAFFLWLYFE